MAKAKTEKDIDSTTVDVVDGIFTLTDEERAQLNKELNINTGDKEKETEKEPISKNLNTTASIAKEGKKSDMQLAVDNLKNMQSISKEKRVEFECSYAYAALYPQDFCTTYQGIPVYLVFDGRKVELPESIAKFVKRKIEAKAKAEAEKRRRNIEKPLDNLGRYY